MLFADYGNCCRVKKNEVVAVNNIVFKLFFV